MVTRFPLAKKNLSVCKKYLSCICPTGQTTSGRYCCMTISHQAGICEKKCNYEPLCIIIWQSISAIRRPYFGQRLGLGLWHGNQVKTLIAKPWLSTLWTTNWLFILPYIFENKHWVILCVHCLNFWNTFGNW